MLPDLPRETSFWRFLFQIDLKLAEEARQKACPCGGRLHRANYPRSPRGGPDDLPKELCYRLSFCCNRDGCRKRVTPPSVRFLGRKVYFAVVVILVAAMRQGPSPRRIPEFSPRFELGRRTIVRWQRFWREQFPRTPFWKIKRGYFMPPLEIAALPRSLLDAFLRSHDPVKDWERLLRFLAPITIPGGLKIELSRASK